MAEHSHSDGGSGSSAARDLIIFLLIIVGLWFFWFATGGPTRVEQDKQASLIRLPKTTIADKRAEIRNRNSRSRINSSQSEDNPRPSVAALYGGHIHLRQGNARTEYVPGREYVVIENSRSADQAINLTGWVLTNGTTRRTRPDTAIIPQAARLFSETQASLTLEPVWLAPGGRAVIITGRPTNRSDWPARTSFLVNRCVGYLEEQFETLNLTPSLSRQCPEPNEEPGIDRLDDECYNFVRRLASCHQPEFDRDRNGDRVIDGRPDNLSRACRLYIEEHFSYDRCLAWHQLDQDFYTKDWRVYLGRRAELWAENREAIRLYDPQGQLIDEITY